MRVSTLIHDYLRSLVERNVSPLTYRDYSHYLNRYFEFAGDVEVSDIDDQHITQYRKFLAKFVDPLSGLSLKRTTQNYMLIALRELIEFARQKDLTKITRDNVSLNKTKKEKIEVVAKKDLDNLVNTPDVNTKKGLRDKAILETLLSTGLLVSELVSLNRSDLDFPKKEISLSEIGGKGRTIYLFDRCLYWLEKYLSFRKDVFIPLFIRYQGNINQHSSGEKMRLTPRSIERIVEKYARVVGLRGKVTPHTFRHFLALNLLREGVEQGVVQQVLGHESKYSTNLYLKNLKESYGSKE